MHVPVWHANTRDLVASGELTVVGIVQEQHPDRALLHARWEGFDWPVLWDPFDLLDVGVVPVTLAVDAAGVVRASGLDPRRVEGPDGLLAAFGEPTGEDVPLPPFPPAVTSDLDQPGRLPERGQAAVRAALACAMFQHWNEPGPALGAALDRAVEVLDQAAAAPGAAPHDRFRAGVAHRLRHDSDFARPDDFQAALDHWCAALAQRPGQYVWRRRVQQWGPRLDKPYPFYDWVPLALRELAARGEPVPALVAPLSGAERAEGTRMLPAGDEQRDPDPGGDVPRDLAGRARLGVAVALHTGFASQRVRVPRGTCRVHLTLVPDGSSDVHFDDAGGPTEVWLELPEGWRHEGRRRSLVALHVDDGGRGPRGVDFELVPPPEVGNGAEVPGYVLYPVCVGEDGTCTYLRQDFVLRVPAAPGEPPAPPTGPPAGGDGDR